MEEQKQNYTIAEGYELPSQGKIYEKPFDPHIELRSMTTRDEMKRMSPSSTPYRVLAEIIDSCLLTKLPVSAYDMCLGDYEYLLHKLRVVSYGSSYKMSVACPKCGNINDLTIDLDSLKTMEFNEKEFKGLMTLTLPSCNKVITLKFQTPRMLDDIELKKKEFKAHYKDSDIDPTMAITLQSVIDTIDGKKMSYLELEEFVNNLKIRDSKTILKNTNELNRKVGLDTSIDHICDRCGYDISTFFRFGSEFFGPSDYR